MSKSPSSASNQGTDLVTRLKTIGLLLLRPEHRLAQAALRAAAGDTGIGLGTFRILRFNADLHQYDSYEEFLRYNEPYLVTECHNGLTLTGVQAMYGCMTGGGTTTANSAYPTPTYWSNAQACIGVGTSTTAFANTQTGLQGGTGATDTANRSYAVMQSTYPSIGTSSTANVLTAQSSFQTTVANFHWQELCLYNSPANGDGGTTVGGGSGSAVALGSNAIAFNRAVSDQGTKLSSQTWVAQYTCTLT
jgi:hypothetical protein